MDISSLAPALPPALLSQLGAASPMPSAQQEAAEKFAALMNPTPTVNGVSGATLIPAPTATGAVESANLGDTILTGLDRMSSRLNNSIARLNETLGDRMDEPLKVQQMIRMQADLMQLSMQQDLTAKIADRTSQGIQTLFKNQ